MQNRPSLPQQKPLSDTEKEMVRTIAQAIIQMESSEGWGHFVKSAEALIAQNTPRPTSFTTEDATKIASKAVFCSGIQACLDIVKTQKKLLTDLK